MGKIKSFINILKGKFIVLISTIHGKIIVMGVMGILSAGTVTGVVVGVSNNSGGNIVPNGEHKWYPINPQTKTIPSSNLVPPINPLPTGGKINLNSMSVFTSKQTYWDTGSHFLFIAHFYKYILTNNLTNNNKYTYWLSRGSLYYGDGSTTHGWGNIMEKLNFQYSKNTDGLFTFLSVYSEVGGFIQLGNGPSFNHTTTVKTDELTNINNKISTIINPFLSRLKQGQKLIITGINYNYNFTILSHGIYISGRNEANIEININSLYYSVVNK